jgi:hypothetical protein
MKYLFVYNSTTPRDGNLWKVISFNLALSNAPPGRVPLWVWGLGLEMGRVGQGFDLSLT